MLDIRAGICDYLQGAGYAMHFGREQYGLHPFDHIPEEMISDVLASGAALAEKYLAPMRVGEAYYVHRDMVAVCQMAAADLNEGDALLRRQLPSEHGFLVFDQPIINPLPQTDGTMLNSVVSAFSWAHGSSGAYRTTVHKNRPGIWVTTWVYLGDPANTMWAAHFERNPRLRDAIIRDMGRWVPGDRVHVPYGEPVGPSEVTANQYAAMLGDQHLQSELDEDYPRLNLSRLVVAVFRLLTQVIVDVADAPLDRASIKRMLRKKLPARVQTIQLRRRAHPGPVPPSMGEGHVDWQHQWFVRGHWAWRACGAEHISAEPYEKGWHTYLYIPPYLKGPEGKPLLVTDKVWGLTR